MFLDENVVAEPMMHFRITKPMTPNFAIEALLAVSKQFNTNKFDYATEALYAIQVKQTVWRGTRGGFFATYGGRRIVDAGSYLLHASPAGLSDGRRWISMGIRRARCAARRAARGALRGVRADGWPAVNGPVDSVSAAIDKPRSSDPQIHFRAAGVSVVSFRSPLRR